MSMLRWSSGDMFAMNDLRRRLVDIERRALDRRPVILTRHGRPTFALVRLDALEELVASSAEGPKVSASEQKLYDKIFAAAERDIAAGKTFDLEEVERRVDALLGRRRPRRAARTKRPRHKAKR